MIADDMSNYDEEGECGRSELPVCVPASVINQGLFSRSVAGPDRRFCGICPSDRNGIKTQNSLSPAAAAAHQDSGSFTVTS